MPESELKIKQLIKDRFNEDIDVIKKITTSILGDNLDSVFLFGGYGRGEGSWFIIENSLGVEVKPYNDYDIAIIVKEKISVKLIKELEKHLKQYIDIKWIDIAQYRREDLKLLPCLIKNYDLKYASKFLLGDDKVLDLIPQMNSRKLSLKDVEILFFTRIWTLIGSFDSCGLKPMKPEIETFFKNQMAKAVLAVVDCFLLQRQAYQTSYKGRVESLQKLSNDHKLNELAQWALSEKLYPKSTGLSIQKLEELYDDVNELYFKYFFQGLSKYWGCNIKSVHKIKLYYLYSPINLLKRLLSNTILKNKKRDLILINNILQVYVAWNYRRGENNVSLFIEKTLLKHFNKKDLSINEMRVYIANKRLTI